MQQDLILLDLGAKGLVLLVSLLVPLLAWSQPSVEYGLDTASAAGLTFVIATDVRFADLAKAVLRNPRSQLTITEGMRPFTFLLTNTSTRAISMMTVRYKRSYLNRPSATSDLCVDTRGRTGPAFKPGDVLLITPGLGAIGPNLAYMSSKAQTVASNDFETAASVLVVMDSVIFEDGEIVGPDELGTSVRYEAERQAVAEVIEALRKLRSTNTSAEEVREYGQRLAALRPQHTKSGEKLSRDTAFWHDTKLQTLGMRIAATGGTSSLDGLIATLSEMHNRFGPVHRQH